MIVTLPGWVADAVVSVDSEDDDEEAREGDKDVDNSNIPVDPVVLIRPGVRPGLKKHHFYKVSNREK
jgi:hypothetical protein